MAIISELDNDMEEVKLNLMKISRSLLSFSDEEEKWVSMSTIIQVVMYYTSAHSSLKSDLKFRTSLLPSVGSIFLNQKMENYIFFKKMVSQKMVSILWFLNHLMVSILWFLNQKMVSQNMVSQS